MENELRKIENRKTKSVFGRKHEENDQWMGWVIQNETSKLGGDFDLAQKPPNQNEQTEWQDAISE